MENLVSSEYQWLLWLAIGGLFAATLLVLLVSVQVLLFLQQLNRGGYGAEAKAKQPQSLGERLGHLFGTKLNEAVPVEREEEVMLDHDYDGIKELDNHLPPWWLAGFYFSIFFGVAYMLIYHVFGIWPLQEEEYKQEMAQAKKEVAAYRAQMAANIDENNIEFATDPEALKAGKEIFMQNCKTCHGENAQGTSLAPNLTDPYWIHGGKPGDIFSTIKYGVKGKGMQAWKSQLSPMMMRNVASYIWSLQGSNPPNAKEPEGEKYVPEKSQDGEQQEKDKLATG